MSGVLWAILAALPAGSVPPPIELGPHTVLVYSNLAGDSQQQFVLRIGRFQPDIVLEWESLNYQGTVHLFRRAVESSEKLVVSQLFDPGVDSESPEVLTKWFSRRVFARLAEGGEATIELNRSKLKLRATGEGSFQLVLNKEAVSVPSLSVQDSRGGEWILLRDGANPLLLQYETRFYRERLERISTDPGNQLRWLRKLPPVR